MALKNQSLYLYGYTVDSTNNYIDFTTNGTNRTAKIPYGAYSLSGAMAALTAAMVSADPLNTYTVTADRTQVGGLQNRVTIACPTATTFSLNFGTSPLIALCNALFGFNKANYTGALSYSGPSTTGTILVPNSDLPYLTGFNYLPPTLYKKNFGIVNVATSGKKETIVYSAQQFFQVEFKYISDASANGEWASLLTWMIAQKPIEFTPDITQPSTFLSGTLESLGSDQMGLSYVLQEMLPDFPNRYRTGLMKYRIG